MKPIFMNLIFNRTPQKPKEEGIYWCILKCMEHKKDNEYHYAFVEFKGKEFQTIAPADIILEVLAWCELENPERHFRPKPLIISR